MYRYGRVIRRGAAAAALGVLLATGVASAQVAWPLVYEGRIFDDRGRPLESPTTLTFRLYDAPDGGAPVWTETLPDVLVAAGDFAVLLGQVEPLPADMHAATPLFLAIEVDGDVEQRPRTPVGAALRARFADLAERARGVVGGTVDAAELRVGGRLVVDADGNWTGGAAGLQGPAGPPGLACWDLDGDGMADPGEDVNGDGRTSAVDCHSGGGVGVDPLAGLNCAVGDFVARTAGGWTCDGHAADPDAHHSSVSAGLDILPNSVTLPGDTTLETGALRLGPQNDQVLSAAALANLTGGPGMNADHLHSHGGQVAAPRSGQFLGVTVAEYDGNMGGRFGVNAKCSAEFPNSHQCDACEVLRVELTAPLPRAAWVRGTPVCNVQGAYNETCGLYVPNSGPDQEWTTSAVQQNGNSTTGPAIWTDGRQLPQLCNERHAIVCCAN